ncbi:hypothetical protein EX30DRAFT_395887 [Ascodesmis nigricans]|uniref:DUF2423 domain-containing protein n=1 Tax=Ascodesmis nigricans TaxID=341454 RepID=A0A4S2MWR3_9PEZI|nr:hypothetical protein EX30DRAFT_395887 [Ascodesmis nigricans]
MAKSARASRIKRNNAALRDTVHKPVEEARLARLSEKLLEVAKSDEKAPIVVRKTEKEAEDGDKMEVEQTTSGASSAAAKRGKAFKVRRHRKASNAMVFAGVRKRKSVGKAMAKKRNATK